LPGAVCRYGREEALANLAFVRSERFILRDERTFTQAVGGTFGP
jgi:hypothetical protein